MNSGMQPKAQRSSRNKKAPRIATLKKGVYILPNFLTSLSLFCGFVSIVASLQGDFVKAAWAIVVASVFDGLDGRIARMTKTTSRFGVEYDSLSDLVAFGVAPAVLAYSWVLSGWGRWGWMAAFLYVACGAIRLARFNVQTATSKGSYFTGLPIPAAAGMVATTTIFCLHIGASDKQLLRICFLLAIYVLGFLMVSTISYQSFKQIDFKSRTPFNSVILAVLLIYVVALEPQLMLFVMALVYAFSGPAALVGRLVRSRKASQPVVQSMTVNKEQR
ncbi:MAG: CDP-diacylglycerol--serine O-phosphatidyltransferase [Desulfobacterota bacterium]|nr:CDP-diacylglycerol--serine O-phosphatidyltransferase [Thermodesulfobacteriota bacterium]